jgi:TonB family protein
MRLLFVFILCFLLLETARAQKKNTLIYYLKNSGKFVSTKDSADFILAISPPDTSVDKKLYIVKEFYLNGKLGLIGNSKTNTITNLKFQGVQITYFPNGHKSSVKNFENGRLLGDVKEYYPNGKLYSISSYTKTDNGKTALKLTCNDSTGKELAINGNGNWIKWNDSFDKITEEGQIENGLEEGEWRSEKTDSASLVYIYKKGIAVGGANDYKSGIRNYFRLEIEPEFLGGLSAFSDFLILNIRYPDGARAKNIQGRVIVGFVVDNVGNLTDIKAIRGIGYGCDEEAARVMKLSPPWKPGKYDGKPVRVAYSVPIAFNLRR